MIEEGDPVKYCCWCGSSLTIVPIKFFDHYTGKQKKMKKCTNRSCPHYCFWNNGGCTRTSFFNRKCKFCGRTDGHYVN